MVPPLVLRSPLKFFSGAVLKIFEYAWNCFKIWKNVFFHQNNHFQIIKTCFKKFFSKWSPLWSWGHPLNFFAGSFEKFWIAWNCFKIWKNVFFHQNNHFQIIKTCFKKFFFAMVPPLVLRSPLKFFCGQFWKFCNCLVNCFQNMKKRFLSSKQSFSNHKTCLKNFFSNGPPLVLRSPLKFFSGQFWKFWIGWNCF